MIIHNFVKYPLYESVTLIFSDQQTFWIHIGSIRKIIYSLWLLYLSHLELHDTRDNQEKVMYDTHFSSRSLLLVLVLCLIVLICWLSRFFWTYHSNCLRLSKIAGSAWTDFKTFFLFPLFLSFIVVPLYFGVFLIFPLHTSESFEIHQVSFLTFS